MKIKDYIKKHSIPQNAFAKSVGCSPAHISFILQGRRRPSPGLALRIERATKKAVTRMEMLYP